MAKESCLVLIKPDGLVKSLTGNIIAELSQAELKIIGAKIVSVSKDLAEEHYAELKENKPEIFEEVLKYIMGDYHTNRVLAMIYHGEDAIEKIREIAGVTHPEKAKPTSIRGRYGRINSQTDVLENCMHASDCPENAEKEIKLWFAPHEIVEDLYPTKTETSENETITWN
jgi:nucleoside-diphosphate kinase